MATREVIMERMVITYKDQLASAQMRIIELEAIISLHNEEMHPEQKAEESTNSDS